VVLFIFTGQNDDQYETVNRPVSFMNPRCTVEVSRCSEGIYLLRTCRRTRCPVAQLGTQYSRTQLEHPRQCTVFLHQRFVTEKQPPSPCEFSRHSTNSSAALYLYISVIAAYASRDIIKQLMKGDQSCLRHFTPHGGSDNPALLISRPPPHSRRPRTATSAPPDPS
jgi:hypothetical protein